MTEEPYNMDLDDIYDEINRREDTIIGADDRYIRLISALSCRLSTEKNNQLEQHLVKRLNLFNRYRESEDFPSSDEDVLFSVSIGLWNQCVQRKHRQDHPVRGADIVNMYVQSADVELADRYFQLFKKTFVETMYERLQIEDEDVKSVVSGRSKEEVKKSVITGVLLIVVWHKTYGVIIPEAKISSEDSFISN